MARVSYFICESPCAFADAPLIAVYKRHGVAAGFQHVLFRGFDGAVDRQGAEC